MTDESPPRVRVRLDGVPETTLWTLYHRARDAARPRSGLDDPKAIELVASIDFPFRRRFGRGPAGFDALIGQRALAFDQEVAGVLATDPDAHVVVLGEGLETQFWRVDNGRVRWLSVELPETAAVRTRLLGEDPPRRRIFAGSALADGWLDAVDAAPGERVLIVAQGLLMYLPPAEVRALVVRCAERFGGGVMVFDTVPRWFSALSTRGLIRSPSGYVAPAMPCGMDSSEPDRLLSLHPNIVDARVVAPPPGGGPLVGGLLPIGGRIPGVRRLLPVLVRLDFGA